MKLCVTCSDEMVQPGRTQCDRCMQYPDGDPDWIRPGDDLTPMLLDILDRLDEMAKQ